MDVTQILDDLPEPLEAALNVMIQRMEAGSISDEMEYATACAILGEFYEQNSLKKPHIIEMDNASYSGFGSIIHQTRPDRSIARAESKWERQYLGYKGDIQNRLVRWKAAEAADMFARKREESFGYAVLTKDEKDLIHSHLKQVREAVERSALNDRKKNKLFSRISALSSETDRNGTHTDRFFAFMGDLAFTSNEMTTEAKPALEEFKEILKIIMRSREKAERTTLPKPEDLPQLPPPGST